MGVYDHTAEVSSGKYFKPQTGKEYTLKICSEPVIFDNVFEDPVKGTQISVRYAWVVYNLTDNIAQIFQLPGGAFNTLAAIAKNVKWGDPLANKYDIDYTKTGASKDTKHSLIAVPTDGPLTEEQQKEVDAIDLIASIEAGKGSERVQWLKDYIEADKPTQTPVKKDVVIEDTDEPINLDDIPF